MEKIQEIAEKIHNLGQGKDRFLIGIYGVPGSGKSTLAGQLTRYVQGSVVVQMDGFHYTKKELDEFPDPQNAHLRRGAEFTFNSRKFYEFVKLLRDQNNFELKAPSFDHKVGDPIEGDVLISTGFKYVFIEGLYVALKKGYWNEAYNLLDCTIFIEIPIDIAMERVIKRQFHALRRAEAVARIKFNDEINALFVLENSNIPTFKVNYQEIVNKI